MSCNSLNTIKYHWIPLNINEYYRIPKYYRIQCNTIENHQIPSNTIKCHSNTFRYRQNPVCHLRCYIHLRLRFYTMTIDNSIVGNFVNIWGEDLSIFEVNSNCQYLREDLFFWGGGLNHISDDACIGWWRKWVQASANGRQRSLIHRPPFLYLYLFLCVFVFYSI